MNRPVTNTAALADHLVTVLQAYGTGETIQMRDSAAYRQFAQRVPSPRTADWTNVGPSHRWNTARYDYRIRPREPVTLKVYAAVDSKANIHAVGGEGEIRLFAVHKKLSVVALTSQFLPSA